MRLEHFQYIVEIARCKSMSKASKKLYITQPSLSTAIQNLEDELGYQIFKRSASGVVLTDKGESLLKISEEIVAQLDKIKELSNPDNETITTLTLAAVPVFCNAILIDLIQILKRDHPFINVSIMELRPCKILSTLISGTSDLVIGSYSPSTKEQIFQEAAKHNIVIEPIHEDTMCCFLHRNHPLAHRKSIRQDELTDSVPALFNDYVLMESYECIQHDGSEFTENHYSFTDRASIKKAVSKGLAYAILPQLMAYDDIYISSGMIVPVPLEDADVSLTTYIGYSARTPLPKATALTIELIRTLYQDVSKKMEKLISHSKRTEQNSAHTTQHLFY